MRLWPGVVLVTVQLLAWFGVGLVYPPAMPWGMLVAIYTAPVFLLSFPPVCAQCR